MPLQECLTIMAIALATGLVSEGLSWLMIYRTSSYKRLRSYMERLNKQLEAKKKEIPTLNKQKHHAKAVARLEADLKESSRSMSMMKMKSMVFLSASMIAVIALLNNLYEGRVIAKLPFEPLSFITGMTHRNLAGNDYTDCSFLFLHVVSSLGLRSNIQKALGVTPLKLANQPSLFNPSPDASSR